MAVLALFLLPVQMRRPWTGFRPLLVAPRGRLRRGQQQNHHRREIRQEEPGDSVGSGAGRGVARGNGQRRDPGVDFPATGRHHQRQEQEGFHDHVLRRAIIRHRHFGGADRPRHHRGQVAKHRRSRQPRGPNHPCVIRRRSISRRKVGIKSRYSNLREFFCAENFCPQVISTVMQKN